MSGQLPNGYAVDNTGMPLGYAIDAPVAQYDGMLREPAIAGSNLVKGAASLAMMPKAIGDLENRYITGPLLGEADKTAAPNPGYADVIHPLQKAGVIDNPAIQPQGAGERYLAAGSQGVGAAIPFAALGGGIPFAIAQGAGSGTAEQGAKDVGLGPWGQFIASMAGSMGAGGVERLGERGASTLTGDLTPTAQAFKDIGVEPKLAGDASDSWLMKWIQNRASELPGSGSKMQKLAQEQVGDFGKSVDNFASQFGDAETLQDAGRSLQKEGNSWLGNFKANSGKVWDAVGQAIGNKPASLGNTEQTLTAIRNQAPLNPDLQDFLESPLAKDVSGILEETKGTYKPASIDPNTGIIIPSSGKPAAPLDWSQLQKLRSRIGEHLENPELISDAGGTQAKQLYGALSQDMQNTAQLSGNPKAVSLFNAANDYTRTGHQFIDNVLSGINGKGIAPEDAANFALSGSKAGGSTLEALREQMPNGVDQLAAAKLRMASKALPGVQNAEGTATSPSRFLTEMGGGGKLSPEAQTALIPEPEDQAMLNSFNTVANSMRDTAKLANSSKTSSAALPMTMMAGAAEGAKFGSAAGIPGAIGGAVAGGLSPMALGYPFGAAASNPLLLKLMQGQAGAQIPAIPYWGSLAGTTYGASQ